MARADVVGVNFHTFVDDCGGYAPICATSMEAYRGGRLPAMPEWYALLLFRHVVGGRLAEVSSSRRPPTLSLEAFRRPADGGIELVAVNTAPKREVTLSIRLAGPKPTQAAEVLSLTAPQLSSTTGVRLGGRQVPGGERGDQVGLHGASSRARGGRGRACQAARPSCSECTRRGEPKAP